jgi:integrase
MRSKKGEVSIQIREKYYRLYWRHKGKKYYLSTGLSESKINLIAVEKLANQIKIDLLFGNFDETLAKYKPEKTIDKIIEPKKELDIDSRLNDFLLSRGITSQSTIDVYRAAIKYYKNFFHDKKEINLSDLQKFLQYLKDNKLSLITIKSYIIKLAAVFDNTKIWQDVKKQIKLNPIQPKPFTKEEVKTIIENCPSNYKNFVKFLFYSGCRIGEAINLKWENVNEDFSTVWILSEKTRKARKLILTEELKNIINDCREFGQSNIYVFSTDLGNQVEKKNFCNRVWKPLLTKLNINYRKPYYTRATMISHSLEAGISPLKLAKITGHSQSTMWNHYYADLGIENKIPEIFKED